MRFGPIRRAMVFLITTIMLSQGLAMGGPIQNPDQIQVGDTRILSFGELGSEEAISVEVPREGTVLEAELVLNGVMKTYSAVNKAYTFNEQGTFHDAWKDSNSKKPPDRGPNDLKVTKAKLVDEQDISASDNDRWSHRIDGPWDKDNYGITIATYPLQMFEFNISDSRNILEQVSVTWEGQGTTDRSGSRLNGANLYLWDPCESGWKSLDSYEDSNIVVTDRTLSGTITIAANQQDKWKDRHVNVLIMGVFAETATYTTISTDDVDVTVRSHTTDWPTDLKVDVGDDDVIEHTYTGKLVGKETFGENEGFVSALQDIINGSRSDAVGNLTVPITFNSTTGGQLSVKVTNLKIDTPPRLVEDISSITLDEDDHLENAVDLWDHFGDDYSAQNLTFSVDWNERPTEVDVRLVGGHVVKVTAEAPDWSGTARVRFLAVDEREQSVLSNNVTITVQPVNDPPVLVDIGGLTAFENQPFLLDVNATDADVDDTLTFSDDTVLFDIDPTTGVVGFTPTTKDIGTHVVNISVKDSNGTEDFEVVSLEVKNVNDPPAVTLFLPTDGFVTTVDNIKLVWVGNDPDGDPLTYNVLVDEGSGLVQVATGIMETEYKMTGLKNGTTYSWTVVASDGKLSSSRPSPFKFTADIDEGPGPGPQPQPNQPPTVELLSPAKGSEVKTLSPTFSWEGYDQDGDALTYEVLLYDSAGTLLKQKTTTVAFYKMEDRLENDKMYFWTVIPNDGEDTGVCLSGQWYFNVKKEEGTVEPQDPVINVTVSPEGDLDIGTKVSFDASASHDPDGTITLYIWTLGDGTTLTGPAYQKVEHTFEKGGTYNVSLVVFDNDGNTGIWAHTLNVIEETVPPKPPKPNDGWLTAEQLMIALLITALAVGFGTAAVFIGYRRIKYGRYKVDQVFLVYKDGRLLGYEGTEGQDAETIIGDSEASEKEVLGGMLAAVQAFVKDSLKEKGAKGSLKVLEYGDHKIAIERGEEAFLAAFVTGNVTKDLRERMQDVVLSIESENQAVLKDWDGSMDELANVKDDLGKLVV